MRYMKVYLFLISLIFAGSASARLYPDNGCTVKDTAVTLSTNEAVTFYAEDRTQCASPSGTGAIVYRITIDDINNIASDSSGAKMVCNGFQIPTGYTVVSTGSGLSCSNLNTAWLMKNRNPAARTISIATSVNTPVTSSISTTDPDNDALTYSASNSFYNAQITLNSTTGTFTYIPPSSVFENKDSFTVKVKDGKGGIATSTVDVQVGTPSLTNRAPVCSDTTLKIEADYALVNNYPTDIIPYTGCADPDGDYMLSSRIITRPLHGDISITWNTDGATIKKASYLPNKGYLGIDVIKFEVKDYSAGSPKGTTFVTNTVYFNVVNTDTDGDTVPDWYEDMHDMNRNNSSDGRRDTDVDGLTDYEEFLNSTDVNNPDTDGDRLPDGYEVHNGFNPKSPSGDLSDANGDFDLDGFSNLDEYRANTNPKNMNDNPNSPFYRWLVPLITSFLLQ